MSEVDELEKLAALKEKGILSEDEFNAKKSEILNTGSSKPKKSRGLLWKIPLALIGFAGLLNAFGVGGHSKLKCDTDNAKTTLKAAFDQSQFARTLNLSAIDISDVTEKSHDDKAGELSCRANIMLNTTKKVPVSYKIEQHKDGKFLLTFEVLDEAENATPTVARQLAQPAASSIPAPTQATPDKSPQAASTQVVDGTLTETAILSKYKASFDCNKASTAVEKTTCSTAILNQLDGLLSEMYKGRMTDPAFGVDKTAFKAAQMAWVKTRNACADVACLEKTYRARITELCEMPVVSGVHWDGDCDAIQN